MAGELRRSPREFGHPNNLWYGKLLAEHLKKHHGVSLGVRQCQRLFRELGFRLRKPRPQVAQADPLRVAAVKKLRRLAKRRDVELWVTRARRGSLRSLEMTDATITITSLGERSVESLYGIIYPPQLARVGFGAIVERAWVVDGKSCSDV